MTPTRYACPVCGHAVVVHVPVDPQTCDHRGTVHDARRAAVILPVATPSRDNGGFKNRTSPARLQSDAGLADGTCVGGPNE